MRRSDKFIIPMPRLLCTCSVTPAPIGSPVSRTSHCSGSVESTAAITVPACLTVVSTLALSVVLLWWAAITADRRSSNPHAPLCGARPSRVASFPSRVQLSPGGSKRLPLSSPCLRHASGPVGSAGTWFALPLILGIARVAANSTSTQGGCVGTIAGVPLHAPLEGQPALLASLLLSSPAVVDPASPGSVILPLAGQVMRTTTSGTLVLLAGGGASSPSGLPAIATTVPLEGSTFVAVGRWGLLVADSVSIQRMDSSGRLHRVAGSLPDSPSAATGSVAGRINGSVSLGTAIPTPTCLYSDGATGDIYFSDGGIVIAVRGTMGPAADSNRLEIVAGNGSSSFVEGALATATGFSDIRDVHTTPHGDLVMAVNDNYNHPRIVCISAVDGVARTIVGSGSAAVSSRTQHADSMYFSTGSLASTPIVGAVAVCVPSTAPETVYFSDGTRIGSFSRGDMTLTVVSGTLPSRKGPTIDGCLTSDATFYRLYGLRQGRGPEELVVVDNGVVYRLDLVARRVFAVAGRAQFEHLTPALSQPPNVLQAIAVPLPEPYDVDVDPATGDVFAAAATGNVVVRLSAKDGTMSVIAGSGSQGCTVDAMSFATMAALSHPTSISFDGRGGLVIADRRCCLLRRLDITTGVLHTIAGANYCSRNGVCLIELHYLTTFYVQATSPLCALTPTRVPPMLHRPPSRIRSLSCTNCFTSPWMRGRATYTGRKTSPVASLCCEQMRLSRLE